MVRSLSTIVGGGEEGSMPGCGFSAEEALMNRQKQTGKCSRTHGLMRFPVLPAAAAPCPPESLPHDRSALLLPVVAEASCKEEAFGFWIAFQKLDESCNSSLD